MKPNTILWVVIALVAILALYLLVVYLTQPTVDAGNVSTAAGNITGSLGTGDYQPETIPVGDSTVASGLAGAQGIIPGGAAQITTAATANANTPLAQAAQPSYSPFDKTMYLNNTGSANALAPAAATTQAQYIKSKLGLVNWATMAALPVSTAVNKFMSLAQYQIQVSQVAAAYNTAYGSDMFTDMQAALSPYSTGQAILAQCINYANQLPLGY